jgi:L-lactate utilization protein LutC
MDREGFLARLRRAGPGPALPDLTTLPLAQTELVPGEDRYDRFAAELLAVQGTCERVAAAATGDAVVRALEIHGARRVALAADLGPFLEPVTEALAGAGIDAVAYARAADERDLAGSLDATVTGCACLVAATGSVVTTATAGRAAALIAPVHVTVAREAQLVSGLAELFGSLPQASMVALQSGPSRTADIEKTLILGMHGPRATHVIVVDEA